MRDIYPNNSNLKSEIYTTRCSVSFQVWCMYKNVVKNIIKIVKCLKEAEEGWIWIREIARRCNLDHTTVSRLIDRYLQNFVEVQNMEPFNVRMIRLKGGVDENSVLRYMETKEKIDKIRSRPVAPKKPA